MRYLFVFAACSFVVACATSRLEKLSEMATPYQSERVETMIPEPVEVADENVVTHRVALKTNVGTMVVGLYGEAAPKTVANFLSYVEASYYEGLIFHRVIPGFMIQGGGYDANMAKVESGDSIPLELIPGIKHTAGTIAMARTSDPESATSQFFICVSEAEQLNGEYAAFGKLEEGFEVAVAISQTPTNPVETDVAVMDDVPVNQVVIQKATLWLR